MRDRIEPFVRWIQQPWAPGIFPFAFLVVLTVAPKGAVIVLVIGALGAVLRGGFGAAGPSRALAYVALMFVILMGWAGLSALWADASAEVWRISMVAPLGIAGIVMVWATESLDATSRKWSANGLLAGLAVSAAIVGFEWLTDGAILRTLYPGDASSAAPNIQAYNERITVLCVLAWPAALIGGRWYVTIPAIAVAALLAGTSSPITLLAFVTAGVACLLAYELPRIGPALVGAVIAVLMLAGPWFLVALPEPGPWLQRLPHPDLASIVHRVSMWDLAAERAAERPALGWGVSASRNLPGGDLPVDIETRVGAERGSIPANQAIMPLHPHNGAVQLSLELGVVGGVLGALLLAPLPLFAARRRRPLAAAAGLAVVSGLAVPFLLSHGVWQPWWHATLWFSATLLASLFPHIREAD